MSPGAPITRCRRSHTSRRRVPEPGAVEPGLRHVDEGLARDAPSLRRRLLRKAQRQIRVDHAAARHRGACRIRPEPCAEAANAAAAEHVQAHFMKPMPRRTTGSCPPPAACPVRLRRAAACSARSPTGTGRAAADQLSMPAFTAAPRPPAWPSVAECGAVKARSGSHSPRRAAGARTRRGTRGRRSAAPGARQRHRVGGQAEERRPDALPSGGTWSGSRPTYSPRRSARSICRTPASVAGAVARPGRARAVHELAQQRLARRPVEHGDRLRAPKRSAKACADDLEAAHVRRQQTRPRPRASAASSSLDAVPAHDSRSTPSLGPQPEPGQLGHHAAGLGDRRAALRAARRRRCARWRASGGGSGRQRTRPASRASPRGRAEAAAAHGQQAEQDNHRSWG